MTKERLEEIKVRAEALAQASPLTRLPLNYTDDYARDVPALVAEVERLTVLATRAFSDLADYLDAPEDRRSHLTCALDHLRQAVGTEVVEEIEGSR